MRNGEEISRDMFGATGERSAQLQREYNAWHAATKAKLGISNIESDALGRCFSDADAGL